MPSRPFLVHKPLISRRTASALLTGTALSSALSQKAAAQITDHGDVIMTGETRLAGVRKAYADGLDGQIHYRYSGDRESPETPLMCLHASPLSGILYYYWLAEMGRD